MTAAGETDPARPGAVLLLAGTTFIALIVCGLGVLSLLFDEDVVMEPGIAVVVGAAGAALSVVAFFVVLRHALRTASTSWVGLRCAVAAYVAYPTGLWITAVATGTGFATAGTVALRGWTAWPGLVMALSALLCGWGAIVLGGARNPSARWPWEHREDDEE